jgi:hypothetical protein
LFSLKGGHLRSSSQESIARRRNPQQKEGRQGELYPMKSMLHERDTLGPVKFYWCDGINLFRYATLPFVRLKNSLIPLDEEVVKTRTTQIDTLFSNFCVRSVGQKLNVTLQTTRTKDLLKSTAPNSSTSLIAWISVRPSPFLVYIFTGNIFPDSGISYPRSLWNICQGATENTLALHFLHFTEYSLKKGALRNYEYFQLEMNKV